LDLREHEISPLRGCATSVEMTVRGSCATSVEMTVRGSCAIPVETTVVGSCGTSVDTTERGAVARHPVISTGAEGGVERSRFLPCATLTCLLLTASVSIAQPPPSIAGPFLDQSEVTWKVNEFDVTRWKTLVGGIEGGQIERDDIQFGLWELAPRSTYHSHRHEVPEIYFVTEGKAQWTVDGATREVGPGMTIYTKPGAVHKMVNKSDENVKAIWVWWAPGGDKEVFAGDYEFIEPEPAGNGSFKEGVNERLY
jgi:quercetin dioxygenase-like cupin family protein